jgi:hypothetical protein
MAVPIQQIEGDFTINTHGTHIAAQFTAQTTSHSDNAHARSGSPLTVVPFSVGTSAKVVPCLGFRNKPYILSKGGDPSAMG